MTEFALGVPLDAEQALVADAARYGHTVVARCSGADELAGRIASLRPAAALVAATPQYLSAAVVAACDAAGVRLVVTAADEVQRRHARAVGVIDAVDGPPAWTTLSPPPMPAQPTMGSDVPQRREAAEASDPAPNATKAPSAPGAESTPITKRGAVIAVWGSPGAPGRTTLAISIAAEFADVGLRVALADADTHAASVGASLGLLDEAPGFAAACRLAGAGSLTVAELDRVASRVRSGHGGFAVLTGISRPNRWPELSAERVAGVLDVARSWIDVLVVDIAAEIEQDEELVSDLAAPRRNAAALTVLRDADHVVAVAAADPVGLARYLRAHAELHELFEPRGVTTVVGKVRASAIGLQPSGQITQTLARFGGISEPVLVPWDPGAFDAALLSGTTLLDAAPRSPARSAIRDLVLGRLHAAIGVAPPSTRRRSARPRRRA